MPRRRRARRCPILVPPASTARLSLEVAVNWLYARDSALRDPFETTLAARIHEPSFRRLVGDAIVAKARIIKDLGNVAVHETRAVPPERAVAAVRELFHVSYWLTRTYARGTKPAAGLVFSPQGLPRTTPIAASTLRQLQEDARKFEESAKALEEAERQRIASETQRAAIEAELAALRVEVAAASEHDRR